MTKRENYTLKVVLDSLGRVPRNEQKIVSYDASNDDIEVWEETVTLFLLNTCDTLSELITDRDIKSWSYSFLTLGQFDIMLADLKKLDKLVMHHLQDDEKTFFQCLSEWRSDWCLLTKQFLGRLRYLMYLVSSLDSSSVAGLHQICSFAERVTVKDYPGAAENTLNKWKLNYEFISNQQKLATTRMKERVKHHFDKYDFWSLYSPHHSSGSVLEKSVDTNGRLHRLTRLEKYLYTNGRICRYFNRKAGIPQLPAPFVAEPSKDYTCQMYVPKGVDDRRIVEAECCERVFVQHGVAEAINHVLDSEYGSHYFRHDSSINGKYALIGSSKGNYDTIDVSSASDSVRWTLVQSLFEYCDPTWVKSIRVARSRFSILPDGSSFPKLAVGSMGSPMTFPLETLVFCELVEEAAATLGISNPKYLVYGDDMVVPSRLTPTLLSLLAEFGFQVNMKKTFVNEDLFRESCGTDAFLGTDITPVRISRFWRPLTTVTPRSVISNVDLANRSFGRLPLVRSYLIRRLEEKGLNIPFSNDRTGMVLKGNQPTNLHLKEGRWDENLQYRTVKIHALHQKKTRMGIFPDELSYWEWLQCTEHRENPAEPTEEADPMEELSLGHLNYFSSLSLHQEWVADVYT